MNIKKIRDNISSKEFNHLLNYLTADTSISSARKNRLIKVFHLIHIFGIRVNEASQITNNKLLELISTGSTKIIAHKQKKEKIIYATKKAIATIKKVFNPIEPNDNFILVSERGSKKTPLNPNSMIRDINSYLKKVFPNKNITSHSFRASLISELINDKNISAKIVQQLIGHSDIQTTFRYAIVSEQNIMNSLELVR